MGKKMKYFWYETKKISWKKMVILFLQDVLMR